MPPVQAGVAEDVASDQAKFLQLPQEFGRWLLIPAGHGLPEAEGADVGRRRRRIEIAPALEGTVRHEARRYEPGLVHDGAAGQPVLVGAQIGRASCRETGSLSGAGVA